MSVASRTPSGIGSITLRSTTAMDWSSFSMSHRRCFSAAVRPFCCAWSEPEAAARTASAPKMTCRALIFIRASYARCGGGASTPDELTVDADVDERQADDVLGDVRLRDVAEVGVGDRHAADRRSGEAAQVERVLGAPHRDRVERDVADDRREAP